MLLGEILAEVSERSQFRQHPRALDQVLHSAAHSAERKGNSAQDFPSPFGARLEEDHELGVRRNRLMNRALGFGGAASEGECDQANGGCYLQRANPKRFFAVIRSLAQARVASVTALDWLLKVER